MSAIYKALLIHNGITWLSMETHWVSMFLSDVCFSSNVFHHLTVATQLQRNVMLFKESSRSSRLISVLGRWSISPHGKNGLQTTELISGFTDSQEKQVCHQVWWFQHLQWSEEGSCTLSSDNVFFHVHRAKNGDVIIVECRLKCFALIKCNELLCCHN